MGRLYTVKRGSILHAQYNYTDLKLTSEDLNQDTAAARTLTRTYEALPDSLPGYRPDGYSFTEGTGGAAVTYSANWAFDTAGRPSSVTDGTDTFTYGYTYTVAGGLHTGAGSGTESAIPFTLDGPQIDVTLAYEATRNVLVSRENTYYPDSSATTLSKFTYTVNAIGLREAVATTGTAFGTTPSNSDRVWKYDPLGQLLSSNSTGTAADRAYTYDSIGNRTGAQADATAVPGTATAGTTLYTANGANQYSSLTVGTGSAFSPAPFYDLDGNMTAGPVPGAAGLTPGVHAPASATLKWDAENRLIEAAVGGTTVDYGYDYLGRLIQRDDGTTVTEYLYDGWNRIAEYGVAAGPIVTLAKTYTWGLDLSGALQGAGGVGGLLSILDKGTGYSYYPTCDGNGNVSEYYKYILDNDTGTTGNQTVSAVAAHFEYDPFGNLTADTYGNAADFPFRFSTKPQDPVTGLYYYGYRWYGSLDGRWPSRDPIEENGGINLMAVFGNNLTNDYDYLGLRLTLKDETDTFDNIYKKYQVFSYTGQTGGRAIAYPVLTSPASSFDTKKENGRCCKKILEGPYLDLFVSTAVANNLQGMNVVANANGQYAIITAIKNGADAVAKHEQRRVQAYVDADKAILKPAEGKGAQMTKCGWVCRDTEDQVNAAVGKYITDLQSEATTQYKNWIDPNQMAISAERTTSITTTQKIIINGQTLTIPKTTVTGIANPHSWAPINTTWQTSCPNP